VRPSRVNLAHVLILSVLFFPLFIRGQQNATVTGIILDTSGRPIRGAEVTLVNHTTGYSQTQVTDADGEYTFLQVTPASEYVLTVTAKNFKPSPTEAFDVHVNELFIEKPPIRLVPLQAEVKVAEVPKAAPPPAPSQTAPPAPPAEVAKAPPAPAPPGQPAPQQAAAPPMPVPSVERPTVQTDFSPILSGVVDSNYVHTLPLADRDFITLALLVPGTYPLPQASPLQGASLVVNGVRGNMNNFLLDGADNNDYTVNQSLPFQIVEAMQEFRVQTSTSTANFGRAAGGQINVITQSGTNKFHGELFEFNRNSNLGEDNPISAYAGGTFDAFAQYGRVNQIVKGSGAAFPNYALSDPLLNNIYQSGRYFPLNQNQFGANIGGPIKKDKLFFFFNWESFRAADARPNFDRVPDEDSRSQLSPFCTTYGCDPGVQSLFNLYPLPNVPLTPGTTNRQGLALSNPTSGDTNMADLCTSAPPIGVPVLLGACSGAFFVGNSANRTFSNNYLGRIDFNVSSRSVLSFKYNIQTFNLLQAGDVPQTANYPGNGITLDGQNQNFSANYVWNISPSTVNKITFGWNRFSFDTLPLDHAINASNYFQNLNFSNGGLPTILIGGNDYSYGAYSGLGAGFNGPYNRTDGVWSISDNFTHIRGRHTIEFGGEYRYNKLDVNNRAAARGLVTFFTVPFGITAGTADIASIARVAPQFGGSAQGIGSFARTFSDNGMGLYAQDTWRLRSNLSLYYGLRWDVYQAPVESQNRLVNDYPGACTDPNGLSLVCLIQAGSNQIYDSDGTLIGTAGFRAPRAGFGTDWHNFGPHVGVSWSPGNSGETVVRAGFAIVYQQQSLEPSVDMLLNPPFIQQTVGINGTLASAFPSGFLTSGMTTADGSYWFPSPYSITARDPNTRSPYVYQFHAEIQQQLGNNNVLSITYVGSLGRRLPADLLFLECNSAAFNGNPLSCIPPLGSGKDTQLSDSVVFQENKASSSFNSLQVSLRTRNYHGFSFQAFYQFAHSIDDAYSGATAPVFLFSPTAASIISNPLFGLINRDQLASINNINPALTLNAGLPIISTPDWLPNDTSNSSSLASERGNSDFDIRHLFVVSYIYQLPEWKRARAFGSGWQIAGITTIHSGQPYSVYSDFFGVPLRPDVVGIPATNNNNPNGAIDNAIPAGCNNGSFSKPCAGTGQSSAFGVTPTFLFQPGNLPRNTFYGPSFTNFDFSVLKNTRITEGTNLQFRAEFFNLFNNTNYRQPISDSGQAATIPGIAGTTVPNSFFGQILQANAGRQIQFGLKFQF